MSRGQKLKRVELFTDEGCLHSRPGFDFRTSPRTEAEFLTFGLELKRQKSSALIIGNYRAVDSLRCNRGIATRVWATI